MSNARFTPDSREAVFLQFYEDLEGSADKEAVVHRYAGEHPRWAADFRAEAALEVLVHAPAVSNEPFPADLPDFRVVREVSRGGMGVVYEAEQLSLRRRVALKVRRQRLSPEAQQRFEREQETLAKLHQTHIVPIHTAGQVEPWQYFAMAYIEGAPLHRLVQTAFQRETTGPGPRTPSLAELAGELARESRETGVRGTGFQPVAEGHGTDFQPGAAESPASQGQVANLSHDRKVTLSIEYFRSVARVMADAAEALQHAHEKHVLHRDVKPSNILIDTDGKCWLIDFGLAYCNGNGTSGTQPLSADSPSNAVLTRGPLGTPGYMAPEQYREQAETRSDVWGLGVTLYELLTLRPAFNGRTHEELRAKVLAEEPTPLRELAGEVPADLVAICQKAMQKEAGQRYATAGEFAEDLRRWLRHEPTKARPVWVGRRVWLWARRNKGWAAAIIFALLAAATLAGGITYSALQRERTAKRANQMLALERLRLFPRVSGWFGRSWEVIPGLARENPDTDLRDQAAATFIGWDARRSKVFDEEPFEGASSVAWDPSGQRLAMGGTLEKSWQPARPARLWSGKDGPPTSSNRAGAGPVAFRPDGTPLQFVPIDPSTFVLHDIAKAQPIRTFKIPSENVATPHNEQNYPAMAVSRDGSLLAASVPLASGKGTLVVWEAATGRVLHQAAQRFTALVFAPDASHMAGGDEDGRIAVWSVTKFERTDLRTGHDPTGGDAVYCLAFSRDIRCGPIAGREGAGTGWLLASGNSVGEVRIWDLKVGEVRTICRGSPWNVHAVAFSPDGTLLASGGRSNDCLLWDVTTGQLLLRIDLTFRESNGFVTGVDFSPDGKRLAVSTRPGWGKANVTVWDLENGRGVRTLPGLSNQVTKLLYSPDGKFLAALSQDWWIAVWDLRSGQLRRLFRNPRGLFADNAALAFNADGSRLAFTTKDVGRLWDFTAGTERRWKLGEGLVDRLVYPSADKLLSFRVEADEKSPPVCRVRSLLGPDPLQPLLEKREFKRGVRHAVLPPDGAYVVVEGQSEPNRGPRRITAYDMVTGKTILDVESRMTRDFSALDSRDGSGKTLGYTADDSGTYILVEMPSGKLLSTYEAPVGYHASVYSLATSTASASHAPSASLAWAHADGTVMVADLNEVRRRLTAASLER